MAIVEGGAPAPTAEAQKRSSGHRVKAWPSGTEYNKQDRADSLGAREPGQDGRSGELPPRGCKQADRITFSTIINSCAKAGSVEKASYWIKEMANHGFAPNLMCYNCLLRACAVRGDVNSANMWFSALLSKGHTPSTITYNCMVSTFIQAGAVDLAMEWLLRMLKEGCQPDAVTRAILGPGDPETQVSLSSSMCFLIMNGLSSPLEDYLKIMDLFKVAIPDSVTNAILSRAATLHKANNLNVPVRHEATQATVDLKLPTQLVFSL
ncbi:Putative pentatricopeptide repeat-containing protein At3g16890 [Durusdinium trenchii]|uniref:Mitochondrial (Protein PENTATRICOPEPTIDE REPEAT 40) n=1 Tax=Durusdinium trenchii TaxID=1381693 RepID=A0ABP0M511_9DINO